MLRLVLDGQWDTARRTLHSSPDVAIDTALVTLPSIAAVVGSGWLLLRSKSAWRNRQFDRTVNFSLTGFQANRLTLRTTRERELPSLVHSDAGVRAVLTAAKRCTSTDSDPLLVSMPAKTATLVQNALLNEALSV